MEKINTAYTISISQDEVRTLERALSLALNTITRVDFILKSGKPSDAKKARFCREVSDLAEFLDEEEVRAAWKAVDGLLPPIQQRIAEGWFTK